MGGHIGVFKWAVMMHLATSPYLPTKALRTRLLRRIGINVPKSSYIAAGVLLGSDKLKIGENVLINVRCHLDGAAPIVIEDYVRLGSGVTIITGTHDIEDTVIRCSPTKPTVPKPVKIGYGSWIGANATVLPGVTIGQGCVVAAGSVVNKNLPANGLYAGVPARLIRELPVGAEASIIRNEAAFSA